MSQFCSLFPAHGVSSNIAAAYFEMGMFRKCETECDKVLSMDRGNIELIILKGLLFALLRLL